MESIKKLYKIGNGPSSSHTMAPKKAAVIFRDKNPEAYSFKAHLYGSLALTGVGHLTDVAIKNAFDNQCEIVWHFNEKLPLHTNGMLFEAFDKNSKLINSWEVYSVGGGELMDIENKVKPQHIYPHTNMADILHHLEDFGGTLWEYAFRNDDTDLTDYLKEVWVAMKKSINRGLNTEGTLPGGLKLLRKAYSYYFKARMQNQFVQNDSFIFAYALAVSEENAAGNIVVTAPTCGSSGILPSVLYFFHNEKGVKEDAIIRALATAGLVGNIVKQNASISGAEVGCQGEVGVASAMAAAAATQLAGGTIYQIEYAASSALEHHLGMTCDPIAGLVQIPCIERNAFGAQRAIDSALYAINSDGRHYVMFDQVVEAMKQTGKDIPSLYKETALGGLAKVFSDRNLNEKKSP
ncbi:MAG: L-serine ammonia-lyase [Bacteroidetes bacterium]|nr:L-serine ammonia-lyase [Bacteroidota bacterium]